jgi:hypothetical protein
MSTFNETFNGFAKRIFKALGFTDDIIASKFQSFIDGFSKEDKYKLIYETEKYVDSLEVADNELSGLTTGSLAQYMDQIKVNWESMNEQLAQLQILSLIQRKEDCSGVIKELLNILGKKIETVNGILKQNLGISSEINPSVNAQEQNLSSSSAQKKYLKYKNKYLALKNLI